MCSDILNSVHIFYKTKDLKGTVSSVYFSPTWSISNYMLSLSKAVLNYSNTDYLISPICTPPIFSYSQNLIPCSSIVSCAFLSRWRLMFSLLLLLPNSICRSHSHGSAVGFSVVQTTFESAVDCCCLLQVTQTRRVFMMLGSLRSVIFSYSRSSQNRQNFCQFLFRTARNLL